MARDQLNAQKITRKLLLIEDRSKMEIEDIRADALRQVRKASEMEKKLRNE